MAMRLSQKRSETVTPHSAPNLAYARPFVVQRRSEDREQALPEAGVSLLNNRYEVGATPNYQPSWIARAQVASQPRAVGIQAKLAIGQPNDKYEQEADSVAEQVMGMSEEKVQGAAAADDEEEKLQAKPIVSKIQREVLPEEEEGIQAKRSSGEMEAGDDFESRLSSSKSGGSPLPEDVRSFMEPRFGADFSGVRVHTGSEAVQMNQEVGAQAFAHGQDVYFGAGKGPGKDSLTAHELTHVVQQIGTINRSTLRRAPVVPASKKTNSGGLRSKLTKISADLQSPVDTAKATKVGDKVLIKSPGVVYDGHVSLVEGVEIGMEPIQVGIIQTITSTNRIGVYRKDGKADGDIVTERRFSLGLTPDTSDGNGNNITPVPPFYTSPQNLNNNQKTVHVVAKDFPAHSFPETIGDGKLTETKGGDHFTSSLAAKQGSELVHLKNFAWDQDWSMILDADQSGKGEYATLSSTTNEPKTPGGEFGNTGLVNPDNTINAYMSPAAADVGLKSGPLTFLKDLAHHKVKAPDSYELMIGALSRSSMKLGIKIVVDSTNSRFGEDKINLTASCSNAKSKLVELNDNQSATVEFKANDVYDPKYLSESTIVNLWVNGKMIQWKFPFNSGQDTVTNGDRGRYKIEYFLS
jgi:hypothetical protein